MSPAGCLLAVVVVVVLFPLLLVLAVSYVLVLLLRRLFGLSPRRPQFRWNSDFGMPGNGAADAAPGASAATSETSSTGGASEEVIDA